MYVYIYLCIYLFICTCDVCGYVITHKNVITTAVNILKTFILFITI